LNRDRERVNAPPGLGNVPDAFVSERMAERCHQRADAVGTMLRSSATALIFGIATIAVLDNMGVSVVPILASLGIAGVAIGFGAQSLIEDLISGVMLIIEDQSRRRRSG
jgi:small conductance mechanosensitive channel